MRLWAKLFVLAAKLRISKSEIVSASVLKPAAV
jgi:hypothetical protein